MTASDWNWLLTISGTVASVVGVIFSCLAWVQAKGAKQAAEEAARSVKSKDTAHEFAKLAADAKDLLAAVQDQRADRAIEAVNDLVHQLSVALARRDEFLPVDSELKDAIKQLSDVSGYLASRGFPSNHAEILKLMRKCQQIHQIVCGVQGCLEKAIEGVAQ
jgi:thioesterase domain-containing protein